MTHALSHILHALDWQDRFTVQDRIGHGGMGQVWRAVDNESGRDVALKCISPERTGEDQTLARLEIEGETLVKLRQAGGHEHVVSILDFKVTEDQACLIMDYVPGQGIRKWCSSHRLDLRERVGLLAKVARAAGWFHDLDVIHRDLKPANILVSAQTHEPVIVDFSIAKVDDTLTLTLTNEALGTVSYMAPEQFDRRRAPVTAATDVYALGATLYELLTEVAPHPGDFAVIVQRHTDEARPARPTALNAAIPRDLECVILKALAHRPADRYADGTALADDLDRFLAGQPVRARPVSRLTHLARQARRRPAFTAALGICAILLLLGVASVAAQREQRLREIEDAARLLMGGPKWSKPELQTADTLLTEMRREQPHRAAALGAAIEADVKSDAEASLVKALLTPRECEWIDQSVVEWLLPRQPDYAGTLLSRAEGRRQQWRQVMGLRTPFTDFRGLFPDSRMRPQGELLLPPEPPQGRAGSRLLLARQRTLPFEIATLFIPLKESIKPLSLVIRGREQEWGVMFSMVRDATPGMLEKLREPLSPDASDYILACVQDGHCVSARQVLKSHMYFTEEQGRPGFNLTVRWHTRHMEAYLGAQGPHTLSEPYSITPSPAGYQCLIDWPADLGMKFLSLRIRTDSSHGTFTMADQHLRSKRYFSAAGLLSRLVDDPELSAEATCKLAYANWHLGHKAEALGQWQQLIPGQGTWQDIAALSHWFYTALEKGVSAAAPLLERLPEDPAALPPEARMLFGREDVRKIIQAHARTALLRDSLRTDLEHARAATKACRYFAPTDAEAAAQLLPLLHCNGLDSAAADLAHAALTHRGPQPSAVTARLLDHWCRIHRSEVNPRLDTLIQQHTSRSGTLGAELQAAARLEKARLHARQGRHTEALQHHAQAGTPPQEFRPAAALLAGALHQAQGNTGAAAQAWAEGVRHAAGSGHEDPGAHLDLLVLHTAARAWSREACVSILHPLLGLESVPAELHRPLSLIIASEETVRVLNTLADQPAAQELLLASAFRSQSARELSTRWLRASLQHLLLRGSFPEDGADSGRERDITERLLESAARSTPAQAGDWRALLEAWQDPAAARALLTRLSQTFPRDLAEDLHRLLSQRHP